MSNQLSMSAHSGVTTHLVRFATLSRAAINRSSKCVQQRVLCRTLAGRGGFEAFPEQSEVPVKTALNA
eukprot:967600-Amphidinium_carterae.1